MEFGYLENLEGVDLSLPPDHSQTIHLFGWIRRTSKPVSVSIGCAKWGRKDWIGLFYPKGTKEKDYLRYYAQHFKSIELNASFYRIPTPDMIDDWRSKVGADFKFCPKFPQVITHIKRLKGAEEITEAFLERMKLFGSNLGPCFVQLPPNFGPKHYAVVQEFVSSFPKDASIHMEFRHKDWFQPSVVVDEVFAQMEEHGIGTVISDGAGRRDAVHMRLTTPAAFIRFVGNQLHPTDYTRLDEWADRIAQWINQGLRELNFFMHQHEETHSPVLCTYMIRKLNEKCSLGLQEPVILSEDSL